MGFDIVLGLMEAKDLDNWKNDSAFLVFGLLIVGFITAVTGIILSVLGD